MMERRVTIGSMECRSVRIGSYQVVPQSVTVVEILEKKTKGNYIEIKAVPPHTQVVRSLIVKQDLIKSLKMYDDRNSQFLTVFIFLTEKFNKGWGFFDSNKPFWVSAKSKDPREQTIIIYVNKAQRNLLQKVKSLDEIGETECYDLVQESKVTEERLAFLTNRVKKKDENQTQ